MTITQQQALHAVDRLRGAEPAQHLATLRQYIEQSTAQPQAVVPAPPQEFESAQGRALAVAWAEGWAQCRDAEYVGEDAQDEAFNQSATLAQCLHADQTRFQGGLSNDQLRRAWSAKLPNVIPTDEQLTAFALGIEAAAQPSAQAERAPVVQAVQATEKGNWWCAHCGVFVMPVEVTFTERHDPEAGGCGFSVSASSGATPADVRMLTSEEHEELENALGLAVYLSVARAIQRKFCAVNAGKRIPADGVIGGCVMATCTYTIQRKDGYETRWATSCGHALVCEVPIEVGFSFAPLPTDDGQRFCSWCGGAIQLDKRSPNHE